MTRHDHQILGFGSSRVLGFFRDARGLLFGLIDVNWSTYPLRSANATDNLLPVKVYRGQINILTKINNNQKFKKFQPSNQVSHSSPTALHLVNDLSYHWVRRND